jgi:hypothetical protein
MGQSNIAAGATIGSNHNSRSADGEILAGRGFWPGLCVSIKHNSVFASFTILAKGDYSNELKISLPFSLVSNDVTKDVLIIMPAYWFMYNMYALARNEWKYFDRDKRVEKIQHLEYSSLAPDTISEIFSSLQLLEELVGKAWAKQNAETITQIDVLKQKGKELLLSNNAICDAVEVDGNVFENSKRKVVILKADKAYNTFIQLMNYYAATQIATFINENKIENYTQFTKQIPAAKQTEWLNIGGQLILKSDVEILKIKIKNNKIKTWDEVHLFYKNVAAKYNTDKLQHALYLLFELHQIKKIDANLIAILLKESIKTKEWITKNIETSRAKDYTNDFRKMVYDNNAEMNNVLGDIKDNSFIIQQKKEAKIFIKNINTVIGKLVVNG